MTDREKAIVMAYTGCTMLAGDKLGIYYQYVQEKLGRSVMTHELAYKEVQDAIKKAAKKDFIAIAKDNNVPCNGWISVKDRMPDENEEVIICYEWTGLSGNKYREVTVDTIVNLEPGCFAIAWIPLPPMPQEESDD